jgi:hypothetical protein
MEQAIEQKQSRKCDQSKDADTLVSRNHLLPAEQSQSAHVVRFEAEINHDGRGVGSILVGQVHWKSNSDYPDRVEGLMG